MRRPLWPASLCILLGHSTFAGALASPLLALDAAYRSAPYAANFVTTGFKAACSDQVAQRVVERKAVISWRRNAAFCLYGGGYQGCVQYYLFNVLLARLFGDSIAAGTVVRKVLFDNFVLAPFLCLPAAYHVNAAIFGKGVRNAMRRYISDAQRDLLLKYWMVWVPAQCITFGIVPPHLRIVFVAFVSFFWNVMLSLVANREPGEPQPSA